MKRTYNAFSFVMVAIIMIMLCGCKGGNVDEVPSDNNVDTPVPTESVIPTPTAIPTVTETPPPAEQPDDAPDTEAPKYIKGEVVISFDFVKQSGSASNQFAVWVEDMSGNYIKTLYVSEWAARGGYQKRPDAIAFWVSRVNRASMPETEVDAVSGATPATGPQSYTWDLTDRNGKPVPAGEYMFLVEGTLRWKNFAIYSGIITISDVSDTIVADRGYVYEKSDNQKALTESSVENDMIGTVTAVFTPFE